MFGIGSFFKTTGLCGHTSKKGKPCTGEWKVTGLELRAPAKEPGVVPERPELFIELECKACKRPRGVVFRGDYT